MSLKIGTLSKWMKAGLPLGASVGLQGRFGGFAAAAQLYQIDVYKNRSLTPGGHEAFIIILEWL